MLAESDAVTRAAAYLDACERDYNDAVAYGDTEYARLAARAIRDAERALRRATATLGRAIEREKREKRMKQYRAEYPIEAKLIFYDLDSL